MGNGHLASIHSSIFLIKGRIDYFEWLVPIHKTLPLWSNYVGVIRRASKVSNLCKAIEPCKIWTYFETKPTWTPQILCVQDGIATFKTYLFTFYLHVLMNSLIFENSSCPQFNNWKKILFLAPTSPCSAQGRCFCQVLNFCTAKWNPSVLSMSDIMPFVRKSMAAWATLRGGENWNQPPK